MFLKLLTVSQVNIYIKKQLDNDFILKNVKVKGEISNLKHHTSGHIYFSLKDEGGSINCVMFRSFVKNLNFKLECGISVIVYGKVSVYLRDGSYQIYCDEIEREGIGDLFIKLEEVKKKLLSEGLFDLKRKRKIPPYPKNVGIVTSETGAAVFDIINVARRRNPYINIFIYPANVQGSLAHLSIIKGLEEAYENKDLDVIILARGGGSIEELWCFNEEALARVVSKSPIPIVTGVGHEVDTTLVDYVSDFRAPTPSSAAEVVFFSAEDMTKKLEDINALIFERSLKNIRYFLNSVNNITMILENYNPINQIVLSYQKIDELTNKLDNKLSSYLKNLWLNVDVYNSLLEAHNPFNILKKGYAIIENKDGKIVDETSKIKSKDSYNIIFKDGKIKAYVDDVEKL